MSDPMDLPEPPKRRPKAFRPHQASEIPAEFYESLKEPEPEPQTITLTLTPTQVALLVWSLTEVSRSVGATERIEWMRLAIAMNDLLSGEVPDGTAESS